MDKALDIIFVVFPTITVIALSVVFIDYWFLVLRKKRRGKRIEHICAGLLKMVSSFDGLPRYMEDMGWRVMFTCLPDGEYVYMGDHYRRHIAGLPLWRKHEILDQLLANAERRAGRQDLLALCREMNEVEAETVAQIVMEGSTYETWGQVREEMPNAIILFRLKRPAEGFRPETYQPA